MFWVKEWTLDIPKCYDVKHSMVIKGHSVEARRTRVWNLYHHLLAKPTWSEAGRKAGMIMPAPDSKDATPGQALLWGAPESNPEDGHGEYTAQMITVSEKCDLGN